MHVSFLSYLVDPVTKDPLKLEVTTGAGDVVRTGFLCNPSTGTKYPIVDGVPRFVNFQESNYSRSFGYQWRKWEKFTADGKGGYEKGHIDQIQELINMIKTNPDSRRIIVSAWNVGDLDRMRLPPCHAFFQFYAVNGRLDLQLYQRSADLALGVPFNIASYSTLLMMVAQECGLTPGVFTHTLGDAHIYLNHLEGLKLQMTREPFDPPVLKIAKKPFNELKFEDFKLENYKHHAFIRFKVAV